MSILEEVLKLAWESDVRAPGGPNWMPFVESLERFYQAAYLAGAKAMQEEAANSCRTLMPTDEQLKQAEEQQYFSFASVTRWCHDAISAIDPENLLAVE